MTERVTHWYLEFVTCCLEFSFNHLSSDSKSAIWNPHDCWLAKRETLLALQFLLLKYSFPVELLCCQQLEICGRTGYVQYSYECPPEC